uniref:Uncharacterized protein n=1 Tax=Noctiluca scintillans TaxID=2966 RepID=A0A7S0ZMM4_NOCSC
MEEPRSERAVRGTILRQLVCPVHGVHIVCKVTQSGANGPKTELRTVPLAWVNEIGQLGIGKDAPRKAVHGWSVLRAPGASSRRHVFSVLAYRVNSGKAGQTWTEPLQLKHGMYVGLFGGGMGTRKRSKTAFVERVKVRFSHFEIAFEETLPEYRRINVHNLSRHLDPPLRWVRHPQLIVDDLPSDLNNIEVEIGVESASGAGIRWGGRSLPCRVPSGVSSRFECPLCPVLRSVGVGKVEIRWLSPKAPRALCFNVRFKETDKTEWKSVVEGGFGLIATDFVAWQSRWIPLTQGLRVSAFGDFDGRKASAPATAVIVSIDKHTLDVEFEPSIDQFYFGSLSDGDASPVSSVGQPPVQAVPFEWVEAVWARDGTRGVPLRNHADHNALLSVDEARPMRYSVRLEGEQSPLSGVQADSCWAGHADASLTYPIEPGSQHCMSVHVSAVTVQGLRTQVRHDFCVRVLTEDGWTNWSPPNSFMVPRIEYHQEELVEERQGNAFYKADLLPLALFKDHARCLETITRSLDGERLEKLQKLLQRSVLTGKHYDHEKSRLIVDMQGPIRTGLRKPAETLVEIRDLVSRRASLNHRDQATGRTPLTYACEYNAPPLLIEGLLTCRADIDSANDLRRTGLCIAASGGHSRIIASLLAHRADPTLVSLQRETALMCCKTDPKIFPDLALRMVECRRLLVAERVPWETFEAIVESTSDLGVQEKAGKIISIIFPGGTDKMFVQNPDGSKRIARHDKLRLWEQICDCGSNDEMNRRGKLCADLMLPQIHAAASPDTKSENCSRLGRYLLLSGVAGFCLSELHVAAGSILESIEHKLIELRSSLTSLMTLQPNRAESIHGIAKRWQIFNGRPLHQWHAHGNLPWLGEHNMIGAFEALVGSTAIVDVESFCTWVGELNARLNAGCSKPALGTWDERLPDLFWGDVYTRFLLGEAQRAAPLFHKVAEHLISGLDNITYKAAPNKAYQRVVKKQADYASSALLVLHEALDLMPGKFSCALRADLDGRLIPGTSSSPEGAILVISYYSPKSSLSAAVQITRAAASDPSRKAPVLVFLLASNSKCMSALSAAAAAREELRQVGADAVALQPQFPTVIRKVLTTALADAWMQFKPDAVWTDSTSTEFRTTFTSEDRLVMFELRKCRTGNTDDLMCAGGLLDMVRGSIVCETEEDIIEVYRRAMDLCAESDKVEVVRVKNGFHTPGAGGYCDLKLFLLLAADAGKDTVYHIGELQVHLNSFLHMKRFSHLPYVIDRGDFDQD